MKKIIVCVIFLLLSINSFSYGSVSNYTKSIGNDNITDSIAEGQLITEINITEGGDTVYSYRYNKFDYGDLSNNDSKMRSANAKSSPTIMSISSEPVDQSKYVGNISFTESVTQSGAKVYSVPIVTASVNSTPPKLELTYNSQMGNGIAGYAWNIAGLSAISIENKNMYYDETTTPLDLSNQSNCVFSLDGARLVPNAGSLASEFQYETAQGFVVVKKHIVGNVISHFTAKYPNGSTALYGFSDNVNAKNIYPLTEIKDIKGYVIKFEYFISGNNYYISKIKYGGKTGTDYLAELSFTYTDRTDFTTTYIDGLDVFSNKLLKKVISSNMHNGTLQEIGTYTLTHQLVNNINRLVQLDHSVGTTYMNPLKLKYEFYSNYTPEISKYTGLSLSQYFTNKPVFIRGKFVKDQYDDGIITFPGHFSIYGLVDAYAHIGPPTYEYGSLFPADQQILIAPELTPYSQTRSILAEKGFQNISAVDYNGDGTDEIVKINFNGVTPNKSKSILKITKYSYINGSFIPTSFNVQFDDVINSGNHLYSPISRSYYYGDFLGNGKIQLLTISHCKDFMNNNRSSKYALIDLQNGSILKDGNFFDFSYDIEKYIKIIDINGDGKTELCYTQEYKTDVYSFSTSGYSKLFESTELTKESLERINLCGDLNGDRKMDILVAPIQSYKSYVSKDVPIWAPKICPFCHHENPIITSIGNKCRHCERAIGYKDAICRVCESSLDESLFPDPPFCNEHGAFVNEKILVKEFDGGNEWTYYISTGKGFVKRVFNFINSDIDDSNSDYVLLDMNNDGMADLARTFKLNVTVYINQNGVISESNKYTGITSKGTNPVPVNLSSTGSPNKFISFDKATANTFSFSHDLSKWNLLTRLIDSYGAVSQNIYSDMTDGSTYQQSSTVLSFPYSHIIAPISLVKNTLTSNNDIIYHYTYHGGVVHRQGIGFCGFEKIETYNNIQQSTIIEEYNPLLFGLKTKIDSPEKLISYTFTKNEGLNKKCNPNLINVKEYNKLTNIESLVSYDYDAYNNPLHIRTYYVNGQLLPSKIISQTYSNTISSSCYLLGLPLVKTTTNNYNGSSWIDKEVMTYNTNKLPTSKVSYTGATGTAKKGEIKLNYDNFGNVISKISAPHNLTNFIGDTFTYDDTKRYVVTKTDALGLLTTYSDYDKFGNCTKETNHKNQSIIKTFDSFGNELTTTDIVGVTETTTKVLGGVGVYSIEKSYAYNAKPSTIVHYNAKNEEVRTGIKRIGGHWKFIDKQYDSQGRLHKISQQFGGAQASHWNQYAYDNYNRITSITEASGRTTTWSYNMLSTSETKDGILSTKTADATGQIIKTTDAGGEISYNYRPDGQPSTVTINNVITTQFDYDDWGRRTSILDPSAGEVTYGYSYDGDISVKTITDARGKIITERTDRFGRVVSMNRPEFNTTYTYNPDGLLTNEMSTNQTSKVTTYDNFGRILTVTDNMSTGKFLLTEYQYGIANGMHINTKYTSQRGVLGTVSHGFSLGIPINHMWGVTTLWSLSEENDLGQPLKASTGPLTRKYTYSQYGKPTSRTVQKGEVYLQNFSYNFDEITGNLLNRTDVNRNITESFSYDNLNRLTGIGNNTITYANNGNILQKQGVGTLNYGNTSKPYRVTGLIPTGGYSAPTMSQSVAYTSFQRPDWIDEDADVVIFKYNASHDRVVMDVYNQGIDLIHKYYSGNVYELHESYGNPIKEVLYLGGDTYTAPAVYIKENNVGKLYYICRDYLGSITLVVDSDGTAKQELSYDAWGRLRNPDTQEIYPQANQPALFLGRGYTGHEHLPWFGLINMNARLYDPVLGRFLSIDPYVQIPEFTQSFNRYSYCLNNPLKYTDHNGEFIIAALVGFFKGVFTGENPFKTAWNSIKNEAMIISGLFIADKSKGFFGQLWEIVSRFTWQEPQTSLGVTYSVIKNAIGLVDDVKHYRGATYVISIDNKMNGMTLGSFINMNSATIPFKNGNFDPTQDYMYMHEYGHYLQSQRWGGFYIPVIGIPSLFSAMTSKPKNHLTTHSYRWYEINANKLANDYFNIVPKWDDNLYPLE